MTAAAADRVSYGCQFHGQQTYFIQALLQAQAAQIVLRGEELGRFTPSLPQLWVGASVAPYRQSLRAFWQP
jgi:hypothetical protein